MMQINQNTPNFKARNLQVRRADQICRMVNTQFPAISTSRLAKRVESSSKYKKFYSKSFDLSHEIYPRVRDKLALIKNDIIARYTKLVELVRKERLANCDEYTRLASLVCAANNMDSQPLVVKYISYDTLDLKPCNHVALALVPKGDIKTIARMTCMKDVIVIDPWLGIADYAPNIAQKYKNMFPQYLNMKTDGEFVIVPNEFKKTLHKEHFEEIREKFPEFVLKNK